MWIPSFSNIISDDDQIIFKQIIIEICLQQLASSKTNGNTVTTIFSFQNIYKLFSC